MTTLVGGEHCNIGVKHVEGLNQRIRLEYGFGDKSTRSAI